MIHAYVPRKTTTEEEQIEQIARDLEDYACMCDFQARIAAKALWSLGYRRQAVGEWVKQEKLRGAVRPEAICSICGRGAVYQVVDNKWALEEHCPHCGAKMKYGG